MFEALTQWFERQRALRELRLAEGAGNKAYARFVNEQIVVAQKEFEEGRREKSVEIWRRMHAEYPDLCVTSEKAINLFVDFGFHDESEALIQNARRNYPRYKSLYAVAFARVAYRRGEIEEALRRYEVVRRVFPQAADGYGIAATCLSDLGRHDDAEAMLQLGIRKVPDNFNLCMRYAQAATRRQNWSEGVQRWTLVWKRFGYPNGPLGVANCLKELGRIEEAEQVLTKACALFESNVHPFAELANLSTTKGDFDEAAQRWKVVVNRFPAFEAAYKKGAEALTKIGREVEADELLREGMARVPGDLPMKLAYARSAHRRRDWAAATERWAMVRERFPNCTEARDQEIAARSELRQQASPAA